MARGKRRKGRKSRRIDPADVLEGRVRVDARQLVELIRRVNPTDRHLSPKEEARRYRVKSRLQDLLVERFSDALEVEAGEEGVVLFRYGPGGQSACHARVAELGEPARRWVRRRLDEQEAAASMPDEAADDGEDGAAPAAMAREELEEGDDIDLDGPPPALMERGRAARDSFDLPRAQAFFETAFDRSGGSLAAALLLLDLLVDRLGLAADALALSGKLPAEVARDPGIKFLLGKAAAGVSDAATATTLVRGLEGPQVAEVHVLLARGALGEEREADAAAHLRTARRHDPASHEVHQLDREVEALRARRWEPAEAEIARALEQGELDRAEHKAREVLDRWSGSAVARRTLREIRARRRGLEIDDRFGRAEEAMAGGDFAAAALLFEEAAALGADAARVAPRLELAREGARARAERERLEARRVAADRIIDALANDRPAGLTAYAEADAGTRAVVREAEDLAPLAWLDELGPAADPAAGVAAALALAAEEERTARASTPSSRCGE